MPVHLLVVDDEPDLELLLRQQFRKQIRAGEWSLVFAGDGLEALALLDAHPEIDLVLTDLNMPRMDGLALLSRISGLDRPIKTVVVSAYGDMDNIRKAMNRGAFDFVTKPINLGDLTATIEKTRQAVQAQRAALDTRDQLTVTRKALEVSQQIEALKSRFFANLSHEFQTPLTLILGPLQDALSDDPASLEPAELAVMHRHAQRLKRLIDQLLDLAKLDDGRMTLRARPGHVARFMEDLTQAFASEAERRNLTLRFQAAAGDDTAYFEPDKLDKIVGNLLSNALKFTPAGGTVRVRVEPQADGLAIIVRDSGPGIPAEALPHLFERFYQVETPGPARQPGSGIGLALTKELVELHGGTLSVESEAGFGSTFTVRFPRGKAHLRPEALALASDPVPADEPDWTDTEPAEEEDEAGDPAAPVPADAPTVLVVEDHADVRAYLRRHLATRYRVVEAADGAEGLALARTAPPDLVVSDVTMPTMDGYALCRALKSDPDLSHLPVILLTARADETDRLEGLEAGADAYLTKPFNARELLARAENLIEIRRLLRRRYSGPIPVKARDVSVSSADDAFMARVQDVVEAHMGTCDFEVARVADEVGLSPRQLRRKIRTLTNLSPAGFVRTLRLQRAAQLLEQQAGTISEIAYAVGFQDAKYFSRLFRQIYGVLPSAFEESGGSSG